MDTLPTFSDETEKIFYSYISHKYIAISHFMYNILEVYLAGKLLLSNTLRIDNPTII